MTGTTTRRSRLHLSVLGAGPAYTDRPGALGAGYLVRSGSTAVVLDLGQGTFARLAATIEPSTIALVAISHLHPDHFVDLVALRHYLRWEFDPPRRIAVVGPRGLAGRLDALHDERGFTAASLDVADLEPGGRDVGELHLEARRVRHTADSFAFRLTDGERPADPGLVYSGDCGSAGDLAPLIRPGDDLLVEASFGTADVPRGAEHLNAAAIVDLAATSRPGRILLTHLQMGFDPGATAVAVRAGFGGPVEFVEPGFETTIGG
jgi:ribonuclease BN (tRNA processing enzyme)